MATISSYPIATPKTSDYVLGVQKSEGGEVQINPTKLFSIGSIQTVQQVEIVNVLNSVDTTDQEPSGVDTPLQVTFGPATGTVSDPVMLAADGSITFNQAGTYLFNGYGNFERQGAAGGLSVIGFRSLLNGVQNSPVKAVELESPNVMVPYELTIPIKVEAGDVLTWEIIRDSSGTASGQNQGGLYTHTMLGPWDNVPSADVNIFQLKTI